MSIFRSNPMVLKTALLSASLSFYSCGSSSSSNDGISVPSAEGTCTITAGSTGNWEITDLPERDSWTRVCDETLANTSGKLFRIENLQLEEGASLVLMPFSNGADNGFSITFTHESVSTDVARISSQGPASFDIDLTQPKTFCVEIHGFDETHIWAYEKGTDAATCSNLDRLEPYADWKLDASARDTIDGTFLGFTRSGNVEYDKIVVTNRSGGTEAGNPSL